jgi:hypothetical protein
MPDPNELIARLDACPAGTAGWVEFENVCIEILKYLFSPELAEPKTQARSYSGIDRRDAIFPNRNLTGENNWAHIYRELGARLIVFEFKNYDTSEVEKNEVIQTSSYLRNPMGKLAILCCNKEPARSAYLKRNTIYKEEGKVILFLTKDNLKEMIYIKQRGEDPSDLIVDLIEWFYIGYE